MKKLCVLIFLSIFLGGCAVYNVPPQQYGPQGGTVFKDGYYQPANPMYQNQGYYQEQLYQKPNVVGYNYGGAMVGGAAGGLLGAQVGQGNGRVAAASVGAATGALVGAGCRSVNGGQLIGGAAGGLLGAQVGQGNGRVAAASVGAVMGALIGNDMAGGCYGN
jgi:uncharacterized protein YcfJ